jgi:hypothetical protein
MQRIALKEAEKAEKSNRGCDTAASAVKEQQR